MNFRANFKSLSLLRLLGLASLMTFSFFSWSQTSETVMSEISDFQKELNDQYFSKKDSPLSKKERKAFKGHAFYDIDLNYCVEAEFIFIEKEDTVEMGTSAGNTKLYRPYAKLRFRIGEEMCELTAYQSLVLRETIEYKSYIFLPFRDATSGTETYGGGRYLDLIIPKGDKITLNFNLAYNPYCAYTTGYNCTIPPAENTLKIAIRAGLKAPPQH